jgi:hypothetical protein
LIYVASDDQRWSPLVQVITIADGVRHWMHRRHWCKWITIGANGKTSNSIWPLCHKFKTHLCFQLTMV